MLSAGKLIAAAVAGLVGVIVGAGTWAVQVVASATDGSGYGPALLTGGPYAVIVALLAVLGNMLRNETLLLGNPARAKEKLVELVELSDARAVAWKELAEQLAAIAKEGQEREIAYLEAFWTLDIAQGLRPATPPNRRKKPGQAAGGGERRRG